MAYTEDTRPENLTAWTDVAGSDLVLGVDDPDGTPLLKASTFASAVGYLVTTAGDILYATAARTLARFGVGTYGQYLGVNSGATAPAWTTQDGWIPTSATWTYASATTFTIAGDVTTTFTKGTKIKCTNSTVKYFYVTASSYGAPNTTVTVTGGSDYALANAAITLPYYSYAGNPQGFPGWFAYVPVITGYSADPTGVFRFTIMGRTAIVQLRETANGVSNATTKTYTLPIASSANQAFISHFIYAYLDNGAAGYTGLAWITGGGISCACYKASAAAWTDSGACRVWGNAVVAGASTITYEI